MVANCNENCNPAIFTHLRRIALYRTPTVHGEVWRRLGSGFESQSAVVQHGFRITTGLRCASKHQLTGRLKGLAGFLIGRHGLVVRIRLILLVHYGGHARQCFADLLLGDHAVMQPVGNVLAGDAQRGAVFHEPHVVMSGTLEQPTPCSTQRTT